MLITGERPCRQVLATVNKRCCRGWHGRVLLSVAGCSCLMWMHSLLDSYSFASTLDRLCWVHVMKGRVHSS